MGYPVPVTGLVEKGEIFKMAALKEEPELKRSLPFNP